MSTDVMRQALEAACGTIERLRDNFQSALAQRTIRDAAETFGEAEHTLTALRAALSAQPLDPQPISDDEQTAPASAVTGWPPGMVQDDSRPLSQWLASRTTRAKLDEQYAAPAPAEDAQPAAKELLFTLREATELLALFGGEQSAVTVQWLPAGDVKDEDEPERVSEAGLYAHFTEYPEDGCFYLGPCNQLEDYAPAAAPAPAAQPAIPAGWRLVPENLTQDMHDAVVTTMDDYMLGADAERKYREDWSAMLAAAPRPPPADGVSEALRLFIGAAYPVSKDIDPRGYRWSEAYLDQALKAAAAAPSAPQAEQREGLKPLTPQQLDQLIAAHVGGAELADGEYSAMVMFAAAVERAHGIGAEQPEGGA